MKKLCYSFLLSLLLCFQACAPLKPPTISGISNFNTSQLISSNPQIKFDILVNNPNKIGVKLQKLDLNLYLNDEIIFSNHTVGEKKIVASGSTLLPFTIEPNIDDIPKLLKGAKGTAGVKGKGSITVKKFLFKKSYPFSF
jgi:LEA14-like dessication related protein